MEENTDRPQNSEIRTYVGSSLVSRTLQECLKHGLNPNGNAPGAVASLDGENLRAYARREASDARILFGV
jgi:hypothetical protein